MQHERWNQSNSEYLTYYPNESQSVDQSSRPPAFEHLPRSASGLGPPAGPRIYGNGEEQAGPAPRRYSHNVYQSHYPSVLPAPQTATPSGPPPPITISGPPITATPIDYHRPSNPAYTGFSNAPITFYHRPDLPSPPTGYPSTFEHSAHIPADPHPSVLSAPHRPSLFHFHSSPRLSTAPGSGSRDPHSYATTVSPRDLDLSAPPAFQPPPDPFALGPAPSILPSSTSPANDRHWLPRHPGPARISIDTSVDGGRSSGEGSYSTSPQAYRMPSVSPILPHFYSTFPNDSSASSSYPSMHQSLGSSPILVKTEEVNMTEGRYPVAGSGQHASGGNSGKSNTSWSGGDEDHHWEASEQPWGMPQEVYKALNSKDKKQVRNRVGARKFRAKRKDYVTTLEASVSEMQDEITELQRKLRSQRGEINGYRRQLGLSPIQPSSSMLSEGDSSILGLSLTFDDGDVEGMRALGGG